MAGKAGEEQKPVPRWDALDCSLPPFKSRTTGWWQFSLALLRLQDQTCLTEFCAPGLFSWGLYVSNKVKPSISADLA
jgi:hypothetical protein